MDLYEEDTKPVKKGEDTTVRDRPTLTVTRGPRMGFVLPIEPGRTSIGRSGDADLLLAEASLSRAHAVLHRGPHGVQIEDLGSTNGTTVNNVPIEGKHVLMDGDRIVVGRHCELRYEELDEHAQRSAVDLYSAALRDTLTGCYNRRYFKERATAELSYSNRHGTEVAVVLLDVDHFKDVNDTWGHSAGDEALKHFALIVREALRTEDVLVRYGGEEFAVVVRGVPPQQVRQLCERVRAAVAISPMPWQGREIALTVSVGVANMVGGDAEQTLEALVATADRALYEAKRTGRNRVVALDVPAPMVRSRP